MKFDIWKTGNPIRQMGRRQALPSRFWLYFKREFLSNNKSLASAFCGELKDGFKIDIDPKVNPDLVYDITKPFPKEFHNRFDVVFADPPYNEQFAKEWGVKYPKPSVILKNLGEIVKPNGILSMLHILIMPPPKGFVRHSIIGIPCGSYNATRVLNVYTKENSKRENFIEVVIGKEKESMSSIGLDFREIKEEG